MTGKPKWVVNWESLASRIFNSHPRDNFSQIPWEVEDKESKWALLKASPKSCGQKDAGVCCGDNLRTR